MAKSKRRRRDESQNLDSLLDTMANVTGILVVLLAVTQISVGDAMARLHDELAQRPELSREALLAAEREAAELRDALEPLLLTDAAKDAERRERRSELSALRGRIAALDAELKKLRDAPRSEAELARRSAKARARARELERAIAAERREASDLARQIEVLPKDAVARDLRLPDPRPPPAGAGQVVFFCRYGRVFRVDGEEMLKKLWAGVRRATGGTTREQLRASTLHRMQVKDYFQTHDVGGEALRWYVLEAQGDLVGQLEWRSTDLGETGEQIASPLSRYRRTLIRYSPGGVYFHFFVWDDSFEVYLKARADADRAGFAAGWTPYDAPRPFRQPLTRLARNTLID